MLRKEARLQTRKEWKMLEKESGLGQTGRVGSQYRQVGRSDIVRSGDGRGGD